MSPSGIKLLIAALAVGALALVFNNFFISRPLSLQAAPRATRAPLVEPAALNKPAIVGGEEAAPGAWPWMAALVAAGTADVRIGQFCGGALVHRDWVLTAAHCTYRPDGAALSPADVDVVLGRHRLSDNTGSRIHVSRIVRHPNFQATTVDYDIALLQLAVPATQPAIRLVDQTEIALTASDVPAMVIGWGLTVPGDNDSASNPLQQLSIPVVSQHTCTLSYGLLTDVISPRMLCAGYRSGGRDSCNGDSGGPLMVFSTTSNEWVQVGIVSWGLGCAQPFYYGVYSRLTELRTWLNSNIPDLPAGPTATPTPKPSPTATPKPTWTPAGQPRRSVHLPLIEFDQRRTLFNGDFELGPGGGWQMQTLRQGRNIWAGGEVSGVTPHSGQYFGGLGGVDLEVSVLEQVVTVPQNMPVLSFWYQSRSEDDCGYDYGGVAVDDTVVTRFELCTPQNQFTWRKLTVNLAAYAGQDVLLQLRAETDYVATSSLYVDDVAWQSTLTDN